MMTARNRRSAESVITITTTTTTKTTTTMKAISINTNYTPHQCKRSRYYYMSMHPLFMLYLFLLVTHMLYYVMDSSSKNNSVITVSSFTVQNTYQLRSKSVLLVQLQSKTPTNIQQQQQQQQFFTTHLSLSSSSSSSSNVGSTSSMLFIEDYLQDKYPLFVQYFLNFSNDKDDDTGVWKQLTKGLVENGGFTLFIPYNLEQQLSSTNNDNKLVRQLQDTRNYETTKQITLYHCINEIVTTEELFNSGGVITLGGVVDVQRTKKGGLFGILGGQEDGNISLNGSTIVNTLLLGNSECMIHEVSDFISPKLLWRYMDQLRIPGSK